MNESIRIQAEVLQHDRTSCRFTVDRPLFKDGFMRFRTAQEAQLSPLAKRLFAIEGVSAVWFQNEQVTVTHSASVNWRDVGPIIGQAIRAHLASGDPTVSEEGLKSRSSEDTLRSRVQKVIDEQINPAVASHGGVISLVDVQGTAIYIQMGGGCQGCGQANVTLRDGIEEALKQQVPEITDIFDATDHASGENPYYAGAPAER